MFGSWQVIEQLWQKIYILLNNMIKFTKVITWYIMESLMVAISAIEMTFNKWNVKLNVTTILPFQHYLIINHMASWRHCSRLHLGRTMVGHLTNTVTQRPILNVTTSIWNGIFSRSYGKRMELGLLLCSFMKIHAI